MDSPRIRRAALASPMRLILCVRFSMQFFMRFSTRFAARPFAG